MRALCAPVLLLAAGTMARAQMPDTVHLSSIPYAMHWENKPLGFTARGGVLEIDAGPKTDMFRDPNVTYNTDNAPKLLFTPDSDFVLVAHVGQAFRHKWDGGALVLKQDDLHWIKFCFEMDYTGAHRVVSVVTQGVSDDCNSVEIPGKAVFFKVAKAGNVITLYCSTDAKKWLLVRHLQFDFRPGFRVGFLAQSPTGSRCAVQFSRIVYRAYRIRDPYAGE